MLKRRNTNIYGFFLAPYSHNGTDLKYKSVFVLARKKKQHCCPEDLSGRENIDHQQSHFGGVIAFRTRALQTAVAKHNNCKLTAILTGALLFWEGLHIKLIVFMLQLISAKCFYKTNGIKKKAAP